VRRLRVVIVCGILHPSYGGPPAVIRSHVEHLSRHADVSVYGVAAPAEVHDVERMFPGASIFPATWPRRWFRGSGLYRGLQDAAKRADVIHAHMVWDHPVWAAWRIGRGSGVPVIVTPHGSLADAWRLRGTLKKVYRIAVLNGLMNEVAAVQALSDHEAAACRARGIRVPIVMIPNGLPEAAYEADEDPGDALAAWPQLRGRRILLYLGRLAGGKGLDVLVEAWCAVKAEAARGRWLLVLTGSDYRGYGSVLRALLARHGPQDTTLLTGPVYGRLKWALLAASDATVLPSLGEGFSMAILEAMAAGRPVLYTPQCHFPELAAERGGWEVDGGRDSLADGLRRLTTESPSVLREFGSRGRQLGRSKYTAERVAEQLAGLYAHVTGIGVRAPA
jgi:glycosyltransferase involved in cell wall biosynthesis